MKKITAKEIIEKYTDTEMGGFDIDTVQSFLRDLKAFGLNFHPDTDFKDYVSCKSGKSFDKPTFTKREAESLNKILEECIDTCNEVHDDISDLANDIWNPKPKPAILITIEGGIVQGVSSNVPDLEYYVVDIDKHGDPEVSVSHSDAEYHDRPFHETFIIDPAQTGGYARRERMAKEKLQAIEEGKEESDEV